MKCVLKNVILAGASGLIGSELLSLLLDSNKIGSVLALVRSPLPVAHPKLTQLEVDFDKLRDYKEIIKGEVIYCCLGSTKKKTPDENEYRKIDHDYPLQLAEIGFENKVSQFHLISSLGANHKSTIFYNRLKGETERDLKEYTFRSIHIYQPSLLVGNRTENRPLEKAMIGIMRIINPFLTGPLKKYRSVKATIIAQAMLNQTLKNLEGIHVYPSDKIKELV